jgi:hypothetical protein
MVDRKNSRFIIESDCSTDADSRHHSDLTATAAMPRRYDTQRLFFGLSP